MMSESASVKLCDRTEKIAEVGQDTENEGDADDARDYFVD